MGRGRGRGGIDEDVVKACGGFWCCAVFITSIVLFACSFSAIDETEVCLKYNTITRVVDEIAETTPGTYFTGIDHAFLCFPKLVQNMEFAGDNGQNGPALHTRTLEGLDIELDVSLEYRLVTAELKPLFDKTNMHYVPFYELLVQSSLRNTVSKNPAESFLTAQRANVSAQMRSDLNSRLIPFHAEVTNVNLRNVNLPDEFEAAIQEVESVRLQQRQELENRGLVLAQEEQDREKSIIELNAEGRRIEIEAEAQVATAQLEREGQLTLAQTQANQNLIRAEQARQTVLIAATNDILNAQFERVGRLQTQLNLQEEATIQFQTEVSIAESEAEIREIEANATAQAAILQAQADADGLAATKAAELQQFRDLTTSAAMTPDDILRYVWLNALKEVRGSSFYIDYKKVPMSLESQAK